MKNVYERNKLTNCIKKPALELMKDVSNKKKKYPSITSKKIIIKTYVWVLYYMTDDKKILKI